MTERRTMANLAHLAKLIGAEWPRPTVFYQGNVDPHYMSVLREIDSGRNVMECGGTVRERYEHMRGFYDGLTAIRDWQRF